MNARSFFQRTFSSQEKTNSFFLAFEYIWSGIFAAVASFAPVFAIRLGASNSEIGLLASLPALVTILISIPAARLLETATHPMLWVFGGLVLQRGIILALGLAPLLALAGVGPGTLAVGLIIAASAPQAVYNIGIWPFYMKAVPPERRVGFFSLTSILASLATGSAVILAGALLERMRFPLNYQVVLTTGILVSFTSLLCFGRVRLPDTAIASPSLELPEVKEKFNFFRLLNLKNNYGRVVLNQSLQYLGIWAATPVLTIYLVKTLGASDAWIGLNNSLLFFGQLSGWLLARVLVQKIGEPKALRLTSQLAALQPLLTGLFASLTPILFITMLNGLLLPIYSLSHNNTLLKALPPGHEHQGIAFYHTISRIGFFLFPLLGAAAVEWSGNIRAVLIVCGLVSLVGSLSFHLFPVMAEGREEETGIVR